ncbi:hypothetical protein EYF80_063489 [Liparis tanakae]|uniref:Uncharacterized protein n=1 Tax=Liparis tanakae TaxID=230148 RepID=A0A4Z2EC09_9TELE|nr:hypothetical protein EYF80_063489 [Liparis tanakae]
MSSGELAATSSMSMPPWGLPTITGPLQARSIRMAKYVSLVMSRASATITWTRHGGEREEDKYSGDIKRRMKGLTLCSETDIDTRRTLHASLCGSRRDDT